LMNLLRINTWALRKRNNGRSIIGRRCIKRLNGFHYSKRLMNRFYAKKDIKKEINPEMVKGNTTQHAQSSSSRRRRGYGNPNKWDFVLNGVSKYLPDGTPLFENVSLTFYQGAKIGILGLNGSGKSSLLKVLAGEDLEFDGELKKAPNLKIGYLHQEPDIDPTKTVKDVVMESVADKFEVIEKLRKLEEENDTESDEYIRLNTIFKEQKLAGLSSRIDRAMFALGCPPPEAEVSFLSGGEKRRTALCRLLISQPDILLLDEPTNHLDAESVSWLEKFLDEYKGTVLAVTHDRYFLDNVACWILEIDRGNLYPYEGNYTEWLVVKQARLLLEEKKKRKQWLRE